MEPNRPDPPPDRPPMEVLDGGSPPGALERWAGSVLGRPAGRALAAVTVILLLAGLWVVYSPGEGGSSVSADSEAEETSASTGSPGLRPAPVIGRQGGDATTWRVARDVSVRSGPRGHTVTFFAVNLGPQPQDPRELRVEAEFVDRPRLAYQATCAGVDLTRRGNEPVRGKVAAGERVFVRCTDTTEYGGRPAMIDPGSVMVRTTPCDGSGRSTRS